MFFIFITTSTSLQAKGKEIYVIPGGDSIGLQISTGVYITGKYDVKTANGEVSPWKKSDIQVGDKILEINSNIISKIEDVQTLLSNITSNQDILLKMRRGNSQVITTCEIVRSINGKMSLGLYVKDEVLGVGTITFIDPNNQNFGALGHSIINEEMSKPNLGFISNTSINGIRKSLPGVPGEKQATLNRVAIGTINKNTSIGVFGKINNLENFGTKNVIRIAEPSEVKLGKAEIWTVLSGDQKEKYDVKIIEVKNQTTRGIKGIKIQITDQRLLNRTGGIIQGMSGSPIIQNDLLVGAVSHVVVDAPDYGYGVYALWMFNTF